MNLSDYIPEKKITFDKSGKSTTETIAPKIDILKLVKDKFASLIGRPSNEVLAKSPSKEESIERVVPESKPSNEPAIEELIRAMQEGSAGDPVATLSGQMAKAGQTMPVYKKYPFLPIATSQLESGGLKDFATNLLVTKPKQAFGWGVNVPDYNPELVEQVLKDMMSAVGTSRSGETVDRQRNAKYYEPFRETGDISQYAQTYAGPITKRNPNAGEKYASNLKSVMNNYAEILDKIMKERGASYPTRY